MTTLSLTNLPLEGDGVLENLYHFLWTKDELDKGPNINIPDTIIYKFRQPAYWYFTAKNGQVKKKSRYNLSNIRIEEAFTRKQCGSDIIAYYLSTNSQGTTTIEYFDRAGFKDFLYNREKVDNGMIQMFVEPKSTKNVMIRAVWSPKILLLERRENVHYLTDPKFSLYEKAVTFEGPEHLSRTSPIRGSLLPISVQDVCKSIVEHVSEVSFKKCNISRMALNFKIDGEDRLWLCWSSSLRLEQNASLSGSQGDLRTMSSILTIKKRLPSKEGPVSLLPHFQVPESIQRTLKKPISKPKYEAMSPGATGHAFNNNNRTIGDPTIPAVSELSECRSCGESVMSDRFYKINYKTLVAHYDQFMAVLLANNNNSTKLEWPPSPKIIEAVGKVGLGPLEKLREAIKNSKDKTKFTLSTEDIEIPPMIRAAHPNLLVDDYRRYKKDPMFLWKVSSVCEECYLVLAQISSGGEESLVINFPAEDTERIKQKGDKAIDDHITRASHARREKKLKKKMEQNLIQGIYAAKEEAKGKHRNESAITYNLKKFSSPEFPTRIDEQNIKTISITKSDAVLQTQKNYQSELAEQGAGAENGLNALDEDFRKELQDRENAFFRDLYRNPNLQHGHPLSHLISTQAKLSMAEAAVSGNPRPLTPDMKRPGSRGQTKPSFEPNWRGSPYAKTQVVKGARPTSGHSLNGSKKNRNSPRSRPVEASLSPLSSAGEAIVKKKGQPKVSESVSAARHREFLLEALQKVQDQLVNPMPLDQAVGLDLAADIMGESIEAGESLDQAWELREKALLATPTDLGRILRTSINISGERLMAAVDIHGANMQITVFNPKLAVSQRLDLPMSVVIENAPPEANSYDDLASYVLDSLEEDVASDLFPSSVCVKLPDSFLN